MTTSDGFGVPGGGSYGFGLFLRTFDNHPTIWHGGLINGFTGETNVFLDSGLAVVVLTNLDSADPDSIATEIMGSVCTSAQFSNNCWLRKSPGFTVVAVVTLALAIGANAVVFSALNACLLRPLNVPQPESLYGLQFGEGVKGAQSYPNYLDFRDRNNSFDDLAAYHMTRVGLDTGAKTLRVWGYPFPIGNYFDVLKIQPYLGRFLHPSDEHGAHSAPYIVLSHGYWHSHFQDDPGAVGRTVEINKRPFTPLRRVQAQIRRKTFPPCPGECRHFVRISHGREKCGLRATPRLFRFKLELASAPRRRVAVFCFRLLLARSSLTKSKMGWKYDATS